MVGEGILPLVAQRFYRAGLLGLRVLEARTGGARRFGGDADARWERFRGHLLPSDRIDLLLGDAAVAWGAAFSPARAFDLKGIAGDEHFGPTWPGLTTDAGRQLWREAENMPVPNDPVAVLDLAIRVLGLLPATEPNPGTLTPSTRVAISGTAALRSAVTMFAGRPDLRWTNQVAVVADDPRQRQLACLAAVFLGLQAPAPLIGPSDFSTDDLDPVASARRLLGFTSIDRALVSQDATQASRELIERIDNLLRGSGNGPVGQPSTPGR